MKRITAIYDPRFYKKLAKEFEESYLSFKQLQEKYGTEKARKIYVRKINKELR